MKRLKGQADFRQVAMFTAHTTSMPRRSLEPGVPDERGESLPLGCDFEARSIGPCGASLAVSR